MKKFSTLHSLLCLVLLFIELNILISVMKAGIRNMEEAAFFPVAGFVVTLSYLLGLGKWTTRRLWFSALVAGFFIAFAESARLMEPIKITLQYFPHFELDLLRWALKKGAPDLSVFQTQFTEIINTAGSFASLVLKASVKHADVREFLWDIPLLLLATWAGWGLGRRNQALLALAPILGFHAYLLNYTGKDTFSMQIAILVLVLLIGLNQEWSTPREKTEDTERAVKETYPAIVLLSIVLAFAGGITPSISIKEITQKLARKSEVAEAMGLEKETVQAGANSGLPRQQLVGISPTLTNTIIFTAKTGELPTAESGIVIDASEIPRHYWRLVTYDVFDGRGWTSSPSESISYQANETLFPLNGEQYKIVHQTIEKSSSQDDHLYWTGSLLRANQPFQGAWRIPPQTVESNADSLLSSDMLGSLTQKQAYSADSVIPIVSEEMLRASAQTYPADIHDKYLSLPKTTPERVLQLANNLASTSNNPYDKARAIEAYLRTYPYLLNVPPPPAGRDVADYFLFDLKTGYCDYYATSMIVLARASGLPARLVIGYSSGEYDRANGEYVVRELHAHSWVEVYFSGVGWVEFEPTANEPIFTLPDKISQDQISIPQSKPGAGAFVKTELLPSQKELLITVALAIILLCSGWWFLQRLGLLGGYDSIGSIYRYVYRHGAKIYTDAPLYETPSMFAEQLKKRFGDHPQFLRTAPAEIDVLTNLYLQETYGVRPLKDDEYKHAAKIWRRLFWSLLYMRVTSRLSKGSGSPGNSLHKN